MISSASVHSVHTATRITFTSTNGDFEDATLVPGGASATAWGEYRGVIASLVSKTANEVVVQFADGIPPAIVQDNAKPKLIFAYGAE